MGWRPLLAQLHFRRAFWQKTRQNRQINLPPAVIKLLTPTGDPKDSAGNQPGLILPHDAPKEPVFAADIRDPVQGQVKLWSSHLGEIWFYPQPAYHTFNLRTSMTETEPFSRVSVNLLVGSNEYLNEHGKMPDLSEKVGIPEDVPPEDEESEDPPGEWTQPDVIVGDASEMWVHSTRAVYAWLRRSKLWARLYLDAHNMGLISVNDPVECPVLRSP